MVKKGILIILGFVCYFGIAITPVAARTYDYQPGKPITLKDAGNHYTILNIKTLEKPLPKFNYEDTDELERFLVVQMQLSVAKNNEEESVGDYMYKLKEGPNQLDALNKFEKDFKNTTLQEKYYLSWINNSDDKLVVKPGKHKKYDLVFKIYPQNDLVLEIKLPRSLDDNHVDRINIKKIQSKNGVTPSLTEGAQ